MGGTITMEYTEDACNNHAEERKNSTAHIIKKREEKKSFLPVRESRAAAIIAAVG
jgi:hypothetical protein